MSYRDVESKDGLLPLLDLAFHWIFNQRQFENFAEIDPRSIDLGYLIQDRGYNMMMCKPLTANTSFRQTYGDKFNSSRLDAF